MIAEDYPDRQVYIDGHCVCAYCGFDGRASLAAWHQLLIEHVIPLRCRPLERKTSSLNVRENKVVACYSCNNVKRRWDKAYDESTIPAGVPLPERVEKAHLEATEFIRAYWSKLDGDFEVMMAESDRV
jgi:5-methylcytosine-specific restriction endonuclease McrA